MMTLIAFVLALLVSSCASAAELREVNYCKQAGVRCQPIDEAPDDVQAQLEEMHWCCPYSGDQGCYEVAGPWACNPEAEYLVYCEWGRTVPQSSSTGTVECYG